MGRLFVTLILSLSLSVAAWAGIGKIVASKGEITVKRDGKVLKAGTGFELEEKDIILSKDKSKAQIIFNDQTVITIGKNSQLSVNEYFFQEGKTPKATFGIAQGAFRSITGKIGKVAPDRFKLKTKTATIGIRGTQILGTVNGQDRIACTQGKISVTTPQGQVLVNAGQITTVAPGRPPAPPRAYKPKEINQMGDASGGGGAVMKPNETIETNGEGDTAATTEADQQDDDEEAPADDQGGDTGTAADTEPATEEGDLLAGELGVGDPDLDPGTEPLPDVAPELPPLPPIDIPEIPEIDPNDESIGGVVETVADSLPTDIESLSMTPEEAIGLPAFTEHLNDKTVLLPESVEDPYLSWGLWIKDTATATTYTAADITGAWASGDMTPSEVIDGYIRNSQSATYTGSVDGVVTDGTVADRMQNGAVSLTFDFGAATVSGNMQFDAGADHWNMAAGTSKVDNSGFNISSFTKGDGSTVDIGTGSADGRFYGPDAGAVGGTFGVNSADNAKSAIGAFTGRK